MVKADTTDVEQNSASDTVTVGVYVSKIYDIDYVKGSYKVSFTLFTNSYNLLYDLDSYFDVHDAIGYENVSSYYDSTRLVGNRKCYWSSLGCVAEISKDFNVNRFPFDHDTLTIDLEINYAYANDLVILIDTMNSKINGFEINNWQIKTNNIKLNRSEFKSAFGDPNLDNSATSYHLLTVQYAISRDSRLLFFKLFTALFLSFILGSVSYFIEPDLLEAKLTLVLGGVFGAIGNKYITESMLPLTNSFTLSDKLHDLTLLYLVVMTIHAIAVKYPKVRRSLPSKPVYAFLVSTLTFLIVVLIILV